MIVPSSSLAQQIIHTCCVVFTLLLQGWAPRSCAARLFQPIPPVSHMMVVCLVAVSLSLFPFDTEIDCPVFCLSRSPCRVSFSSQPFPVSALLPVCREKKDREGGQNRICLCHSQRVSVLPQVLQLNYIFHLGGSDLGSLYKCFSLSLSFTS